MTLPTRPNADWTRRLLIVVVVAWLLVSLVGPVAAAERQSDTTFVESDVTADTTWTPDGGPYRIVRDVHVAPGATLTILPGTDVQLAEQITLSVDGSLYANGTDARPVTFSRTDGAASDRRWASIRYNGTGTSRLELRNTTLEGGTSGITVDRSEGSVAVVDSTLRDFSAAGVSVDDTAATPSITVERSAFRAIGGHAVRATPSTGATGDVSVRASPVERGNRSNHTLSLDAGVGVAFDTIDLRYPAAGSVGGVDAESIARLGLDRNRNRTIERSFAPFVTDVSSRENRLQISLSRPVRVPSDGRLLVEYNDTVNPATRGVYPVGVDLRRAGVSQLSDGVQGSFVVGNVTPAVDGATAPETSVQQLVVRESTFDRIDGNGVFVAADTVRRLWLVNNQISETAGSGVAVRAARSETNLWNNEVSADDAGVRIDARSHTSATAHGNQIRDARTGIRIRQSGTETPRSGEVSLRENSLADNAGHGIDIAARSLDLRVRLSNNTVRDNGRDGVHLRSWLTRRSVVRGNRIADNGGDGFALEGSAVTNLTLAHNEVVNNAGTGVAVRTRTAARRVTVRDNTVRDGGGHGVAVRSELIVHRTDVRENRLANNAGSGLLVASPITHRGNLSVAHNTVAANSYGIVVRGAVDTSVRENAVVFNTNAFADPVPLSDVDPGTGVYVAEGAAGAIVNQAQSTIPLEELVANPALTERLTVARLWEDTVVVLRTDGASQTRAAEASALSIRQVSGTLPTGVGVQTAGEGEQSHQITNNSIYGHRRGLAVDMAPLISANTTARIVVDPIRTVDAESNYWGGPSGPYHSSILPEGEGDPVVTERGWVDITPFRTAAPEPPYARPVPRLDAPATATPASRVRLSGASSTSDRSPVGRYHFVVNGTARPPQSSPILGVTMPRRPLDVGLAVESRLGIDSDTVTTTTVDAATATATETATSAPTTATGTSVAATSPSRPTTSGGAPLAGLGSTWGLLGGALYLSALVLGGYGMVLSLRDRSPPVGGLRIQALAVAAVLVWLVGGAVDVGALLGVGVAAAVSWGGLTAAAYVLATRG
jgi:hypothetical protein